MQMTRRSAIAGLAVIASGTFSMSAANAGEALDRIMSDGVLTVATNSDYPPNSFMNDDNELDGFDISVAKEIGNRMGVEVEFVTPGWEIMTAGRWSGRWDWSSGL